MTDARAQAAAASACGRRTHAAAPHRPARPRRIARHPRPPARPRALQRTLDAASALEPLHSLIVARDGEIIAERRFGGPPLDRPANIKSVSKAVIAALVGIAIARGVLAGPDQPIAPLLADRMPRNPDPRLHAITIDHLLSMRAGLERTSGVNYGRWVTSGDWVRHVLSRPFIAEPGGPMLYSTGNSHLLSALLTRASGRSTLALARDWLGDPLGITIPPWPRDPPGHLCRRQRHAVLAARPASAGGRAAGPGRGIGGLSGRHRAAHRAARQRRTDRAMPARHARHRGIRRRGTRATDAAMILLPTPNRRPTLRRELSAAERPTHVRIAAAADHLHVHRRHLQEVPGARLGARFRRGPLL
jgi:CubicO group peptidase (beta-lactamase class C family)